VRLVRALRRVGERGGVGVGEPTELDPEIALFLFEDASTAVRNATMRRLSDAGADSNDLQALENLVSHLARVPDDAWEGRKSAERGRPIPGVERRRRTKRRRALRKAQAER
jgi:hypothetical protein